MHTDPYYLFNDIIEGDYVTDGEAFTDYEELISILQTWKSEGKIRELEFEDPNQVLHSHYVEFVPNAKHIDETFDELHITKKELEQILPLIDDLSIFVDGKWGLSRTIYKAK